MTSFRFISDERMRVLIERDKRELDGCVANELNKAALLLAGSIVEAILVDYFLAFPKPDTSPAKVFDASLANLIDWAVEDRLISPRTKEISTVIRNYRNLIHPGREYRLQERVDLNTARVAAGLVEIIINEVATNYAEKRGYTAEQALQKVKVDPEIRAIRDHIIKTMSSVEQVRLFRILPEICADYPEHTIDTLIELHVILKKVIPEAVRREEAEKVYELIRSSSQRDALFRLRFFGNDSHLLTDEHRAAITDYLTELLATSPETDLGFLHEWFVFQWLGDTLNNEEGMKSLVGVTLVRSLGSDRQSDTPVVAEIIKSEIMMAWPTESQEIFVSLLRQNPHVPERWIDHITSTIL